jgi:hypothetical protein
MQRRRPGLGATPHWPGVGLGDDSGLDAISSSTQIANQLTSQYGISIPTSVPSAVQTAYGALPASIQTTITQGVSAYSQLQPAISMAAAITSGGSINPQALVGAVSAAATVFAGPIAGAAVGACGEAAIALSNALQGLFSALGLYSHDPNVAYCGLIPSSSIPYGPQDPAWVHINTPTDLYRIYFGPNSLSTDQIHIVDDPGLTTMVYFYQWTLGYLWPNDAQCFGNLPLNSIGVNKNGQGSCVGCPATNNWFGYTINTFDLFFAMMMKTNMENWANCSAYLPPRQLLYSAVQLWNASKPQGSPVTYNPIDMGQNAQGQDNLSEGSKANLVSLLLGAQGDPNFYTADTGSGKREAPLTVIAQTVGPAQRAAILAALNAGTGPSKLLVPANEIKNVPMVAASSGITTSQVAGGAAAVVGTAVLGTIAYSVATGAAVDIVLKNAWKGITKLFTR